jgi:ribulose kinase
VHSATRETQTWKDESDSRIFEQSTNDIWKAIAECTRALLSETGVTKESVKCIGIDATCSLAVIDFEGNPVCVTKGNRCGEYGERNIVLLADHRAENEANAINATRSVVLDYLGGSMNVRVLAMSWSLYSRK